MPNNPRFPPNVPCATPITVELLAFAAVQVLDITGPLQVFATANDQAAAAGMNEAPYRTRVVGLDGTTIETSSGLSLVAAALPDVDIPVDTLVVAGGIGVRKAASDPSIVDWVRRRAGTARRVASVCTGAFLLAATGMLDRRRATTHWSASADLAREYPAVHVEPDPIFINDGTVWTSAGVTAGIDLALALVEEDLGPAAALAVARHLVVFLKRPGGQSQFSAALSLQAGEDRFGRLNTWIGGHLASDLSLGALARQAGMSERNFSRRYAEAVGATPARAVERLRVEGARHLLSDTGLSVKGIAARCGFGAEETMRRSFLRLLSTTPQDYRARFSP